MNPSRIIVLLVALLAAVGAGWFLLSEHPQDPPSDDPPAVTTPTVEKEKPTANLSSSAATTPPTEAVQRSEVKIDKSRSESPQGVYGQVFNPAGAPEPSCQVFLSEAAGGTNIFKMMQLQQRGVTLPPVAATTTDAQGKFRLGLEFVEADKVYDVRVLSTNYADLTHPGIRMTEGQWYNAARLDLKAGVAIVGQVTVAGTNGLPVADAEVSVKPSGGTLEISIIPGRERGIVTRTDAAGFFRVSNVTEGVQTVSAVAAGYARVSHSNVTISAQTENRLNFELPQGRAISGRVINGAGEAVPHARVTAIAISSKTPITEETLCDDHGKFEILGLVEGPYQITVKAEGYVNADEKPVEAGTKGLEMVVEKQGSVFVTVLGRNGQTLREYRLIVKSYFAGQPAQPQVTDGQVPPPPPQAIEPTYGNTMIPEKQVRGVKDGVATVEGLDPGTYALQVLASNYAMAFSEPFTIAVGTESPRLTVQLNEGGIISGQVVSQSGQPIAGATVETRPNDLDDNPFTDMFAGMIPTKVTRVTVHTDAQGRFEIKMLNEGRYQLKVAHPEYVLGYHKDHNVLVGQTLTLPPIVLQTGCVLSGTVRVAGKPTGQVKVSVTTKTDPNVLPAQRPASFMSEAFTDNEGRYVIPKRLPPGLYEVMSAQQTLANPLLQIVQFQKSKQELSIGGQTQMVVDFALDEVR